MYFQELFEKEDSEVAIPKYDDAKLEQLLDRSVMSLCTPSLYNDYMATFMI